MNPNNPRQVAGFFVYRHLGLVFNNFLQLVADAFSELITINKG